MSDDQCHVRIEFGPLVFDYCAPKQAAIQYAHDIGEWLGVPVLVDDEVRDDLPPLPCESLWA
ncbi:hypothetical protein [Nocardia aurantia]|uniref:Uncharacterized protein n=1 Tax=Nocardia aurantia TaxID=2585199 RepID=A0A7K0DZM3_9NOCA|nr:hypothetical protein [Nocardia aurantia]MQY31263.1 hypothetical protein [Nocardia aurantia]